MYTQCLSFLVRSCQGFHNSNYKSIPADFSRDHSWYIVGEWRYPNCPYIFYAHNVLGPEIRLHGREHNLHSYASKILKGQQEREHITFFFFSPFEKSRIWVWHWYYRSVWVHRSLIYIWPQMRNFTNCAHQTSIDHLVTRQSACLCNLDSKPWGHMLGTVLPFKE